MIPFHENYRLKQSYKYIKKALKQQVDADGKFTELCEQWMEDRFESNKVMMTTSGTHALELALQSLSLKPEDEVIIPSFTYPSTANAVLLSGAKVVLTEVGQDMLMDASKLKDKINEHTKAIIVVHYGGFVCEMDEIMPIASRHGLVVIEDAAQSFLSVYKGRYAGTIGDFGCFSFHGTKDIVAGEGGALIVKNWAHYNIARIFRQKGTNRSDFIEGKIDRYEWVDKGSSYGPSEVLMALLYGQLNQSDDILFKRLGIFNAYYYYFKMYRFKSIIGFSGLGSKISDQAGNGHLFYLVFDTVEHSNLFRKFMKQVGIETRTHFVPLHESQMGKQFCKNPNSFVHERHIGKRLVRLPIYPDLKRKQLLNIIKQINQFLRCEYDFNSDSDFKQGERPSATV